MKISLTIIFTLLLGGLIAQNENSTFIIKFQDKGQSKYSIANPTTFLSERAIERRLLQQIPIDEYDLPINPAYLAQVQETGAKIIYTSKWLNTIIVRLNDPKIIDVLEKLSFIEELSRYETIKTKKNNLPFKKFFQQERYNKFDIKEKSVSVPLGFNYGPSANQIQMIKIDQLHNQGFTGNGITIAVMDAGFNSVNILDAFDTLFFQNRILGTRDFVEPGNSVYDTDLSLHGTMVLSTMGGNLPGQLVGTAPHASYYLFRTEDATDEYLMEEFFWVQAAEYADSLGADILSTSLGYTQFPNYPSDNHTYEDLDGNTTIITIGADIAAQKGMLVVNSAGNEGDEAWKYISAPADGDSVLTVGAVFPDGTYAQFSSVGPTADGRIKPDVATQGVNVIVAILPSGISQGSGTSFACPILSGAAACLWQANPTYSNMEIYNAIKSSANRASNPDNLTGWGIPDFVKANSILVGEIDKINYSSNITCFPNPFSDYLIAQFNSKIDKDTIIRLLNTRGEVLRTINVDNLKHNSTQYRFTDLNQFPKGIYFIQVSTSEGTFTQKVIK